MPSGVSSAPQREKKVQCRLDKTWESVLAEDSSGQTKNTTIYIFMRFIQSKYRRPPKECTELNLAD